MKMLIKYIFTLIVSCSFSFFAHGQMLNLNFSYMTKENGLSSNFINCGEDGFFIKVVGNGYYRHEKQVIERTEELQKANTKIRELHKLKLDLFTNLSHELKTPLTLILGLFARVIATDKNDQRICIQ